jgi:hypothetical protein
MQNKFDYLRLRNSDRNKNGIEKEISKTHNEYKEFEGKQYTGMKVEEATSGIMIKTNGKRKS